MKLSEENMKLKQKFPFLCSFLRYLCDAAARGQRQRAYPFGDFSGHLAHGKREG